MKEKWRDIIGYEGYYQVSNLGRVRSLDRIVPHTRYGTMRVKGRIIRSNPCGNCGHLGLTLAKNNIDMPTTVHQLVAVAFMGPCPEGMEVCHNSKERTDNSTSNLRYDTHKNNGLQRRKDDTHCGRPVRRSDGVEFINMTVAAEESGCDSSHIGHVCKGKRKTAGGYGWEYLEEK